MGRAITQLFGQGGKTKRRKKITHFGPRPDYMNTRPAGMYPGPTTQPNGMVFGNGGSTDGRAIVQKGKAPSPDGRAVVQRGRGPYRSPYGLGGTLGGILGAAAGSLIPIPGLGTALGTQFGSMIGGQFDNSQGQVPYGATPPLNPYFNGRMNHGGFIPPVMINVEGTGVQSGSPTVMKKGEILSKGGRVLKNYVSRPPHPAEGMNPLGDTNEAQGNVVIPKNRTQEYMRRSLADRRMIEKSLVSQQVEREMKSMRKGGMAKYCKKGGKVKKYATGGLPNPYEFQTPNTDAYGYVPMDPNIQFPGQAPQQAYMDPAIGLPPTVPPPANPNYLSQQDITDTEGNFYNPYDTTVETNIDGNAYSVAPNARVQASSLQTQSPAQGFRPNWQKIGRTAEEVGSYAAPAFNVGMGLFAPVHKLDPREFEIQGKVPYRDIKEAEPLRQINTGYRTGLYNLRNSGKYTQAGQVNLASAKMRESAAMRERLAAINTQNRNEADRYNIATEGRNKLMRFNIADYNDRAHAAREAMLATGLGQVSQISQGRRNDRIMLDNLSTLFDDFTFDKSQGKFIPRPR